MRHLHSMTSDWIRPEAYLIHVLFPTSIKYIERFICGFFFPVNFSFSQNEHISINVQFKHQTKPNREN